MSCTIRKPMVYRLWLRKYYSWLRNFLAKFSDFFANLGKVLPKIPYLAISNTYHHHVIHNITMYNDKIIS